MQRVKYKWGTNVNEFRCCPEKFRENEECCTGESIEGYETFTGRKQIHSDQWEVNIKIIGRRDPFVSPN